MGLAIIIPNVSFSDANLGKVTLSGEVPIQGLHINLDDSYIGLAVDLVATFLPANTTQRNVIWSIEDGTEYASISGSVLTIKDSAFYNNVTIKCTSVSTPSVFDRKTIKVTYEDSSPIQNPQLRFPLTTDGNDLITGLSPASSSGVTYTNDGVLIDGSKNNAGLFYNINNVAYKSVLFDVKYMNGTLMSAYPYMFCLNHVININRHAASLYYDKNGSKVGATIDLNMNDRYDGVFNSKFVAEQWNKIAIVMDATTSKVYINGVLATTINKSSASVLSNCDKLIIGNTANGDRPFNGYIKNFYCFERELTETEAINYTTL